MKMGRLADVGQPTRRIESTRRVLGLSVVLSCYVGIATLPALNDKLSISYPLSLVCSSGGYPQTPARGDSPLETPL